MPRIALDFERLFDYDDDDGDADADDDCPFMPLFTTSERTAAVWDDLLDTALDDEPTPAQTYRRDRYDAEQINRRLANMYLLPLSSRRPPARDRRRTTPTRRVADPLLVDELLHEASAMLRTFERFSLALGPAVLRRRPRAQRPVSPLAPSEWEAVVEERCAKLASQLADID